MDLIAQLYQEGWTIQEIAEKYGLNWRTAKRAIIKTGLEIRPRGPVPRDLRSPILKLHREGHSPKEIAEATGHTKVYIYSLLRREDFTVKEKMLCMQCEKNQTCPLAREDFYCADWIYDDKDKFLQVREKNATVIFERRD